MPIGTKIIFDLGLIVAGTGLLKIGKDRMLDDVEVIKDCILGPEETNVYEVNDFEIVDF